MSDSKGVKATCKPHKTPFPLVAHAFFSQYIILDELVKSPKRHLYVIPMKMGIQCFQIVAYPLDSRCSLSRIGCGAGMTTFYETVIL